MREFGDKRRVLIVHFAKNKEILATGFFCSIPDRWDKTLPELVVDVLDRVETEARDFEYLNLIRVDIDHAPDNAWLLGKQIVETGDIPVLRALPSSRGPATVMIHRRIV